jgi:hypothetical protein
VQAYGLCTEYDEFVQDKCIWVVTLKDGTKVFQDDDRPGIQVPSAWRRLGFYVGDHPYNPPVAMRLRFGTNIVELPSEQPFYFYSKGLLQAMNMTYGLDFHIVGWPDDGKVLCTWFKVPELAATEQRHRELSDCRREQLVGAA